jgi:hypothetical protein
MVATFSRRHFGVMPHFGYAGRQSGAVGGGLPRVSETSISGLSTYALRMSCGLAFSSGDGRRRQRDRAARRDVRVKRVAFQLLIAILVTISIGRGSYVSAEAATSRPSQFCTSIKPGEKASQRLIPLLTSMSHHTVANTKSQLLTDIDAILTTLRSVRIQLRSVPSDVQSSFRWDLLAEGKAKPGCTAQPRTTKWRR